MQEAIDRRTLHKKERVCAADARGLGGDKREIIMSSIVDTAARTDRTGRVGADVIVDLKPMHAFFRNDDEKREGVKNRTAA